jgi:hypothetical protein
MKFTASRMLVTAMMLAMASSGISQAGDDDRTGQVSRVGRMNIKRFLAATKLTYATASAHINALVMAAR